jgi:hypothetical protein
MSTQLILYPQNYSGYTSSSVALIEYFVDGQNFSDVNASTTTLVTQPSAVQNAINSIAPSMVTNTWYRYYTGASVGVTESSNRLTLEVPNLGPGDTGIIQKLSNLTVGQVYEASVNFSLQFGESAKAYMYSGTVLQSTHNLPDLLLFDTTFQFTAVTTSQSIVINKHRPGLTTGKSIINSISITKQSQPTSTVSGDGQVICDLYAEEDIPLTLSIDDFKNVAEKVQSYSKDFNLPATKRNNQIFNNMFEVTRADDGLIFNPYVRTKCVLKQDGFILFEGYLRLIDAKEKEGEISYNVNLYSEVIALADILKESTFSDLDFTELEHDYNKLQIGYSWNDAPATGITYLNPNTSGFRNANDTLKYPFIDWNHQYLVGQTSGSGNSATAGNPELTLLEDAFRPCIQLKYLINKIFAASGFNWTSNFFDSADFDKLYMDFNWGANEVGTPATGGQYGQYSEPDVFSTTSFAPLPLSIVSFDSAMGYDIANSRFVATYNFQTYLMEVPGFVPAFLSSQTLDTRWAKYDSGGVLIDTYNVASTAVSFGSYTMSTPLTTMILQAGDYIQFEWKTNTAGEGRLGGNDLLVILGAIGAPQVTSNILLQTLRGELGQWDFLKGIMTMFNLISMVDESNPDNILIEPYSDIFINNTNGGPGNLTLKDRGIQHDWTDKIDASEMELKPLTDLNIKTIFKFVEDDDDYCFNVFKQAQSGHLYGSKVLSASGFTILEGTEEITAEPFAATVSKPIDSSFPSFIIPSLYAMNDDGTCEGFDNSPRVFYNNGIKDTGASYYIPAQNGETSSNETDFLQFSHLSNVPTITTTRDFVFESSQLSLAVAPTGPPANNLYSIYWQPYFNELYNADTRTMTLKVNLSPSDVAAFKFYDTVMIKNRSFRVNKIQYKPNSLATVEFILIP